MFIIELDEKNFYKGFIELDFNQIHDLNTGKLDLNYTTVQITTGFIKPRFNHSTKEWFEGATVEEIEAWNKEDDMKNEEILKATSIEEENKLLKEKVETLEAMVKSHEQLISQIAMKVYNC